MLVQSHPPVHLTYCLNVHPGQSWAENFAAIQDKALAVRDRVCPAGPFGLGLRLSAQAARTLARPEELAAFRQFLQDQNLYAFTINGFPYGAFHGTAVKQDVYRPDWRSPERKEYTLVLADILAALLGEGVSGSISTVPLSYKGFGLAPGDLAAMAGAVAEVAMHLHELRNRTGREISLALESEPDCTLENTPEVVAFFAGPLRQYGVPILRQAGLSADQAEVVLRRHVGVCFDTSHLAVEFEDLSDSLELLRREGIRLSKIHLSSALRAAHPAGALEQLATFCDPVYLHQVKCLSADGEIRSFADLPDALAQAKRDEEWRVHFHVPLFFDKAGALESTSGLLDERFAALLRGGITDHVEIETYTFSVLPPLLAVQDVTDGIAREFEWVFDRFWPKGKAKHT